MARKKKKKSFFDFNKFDATDLIAIVIIVGGFYLLLNGVDTVVGGVVTMVSGFYFGRKANV